MFLLAALWWKSCRPIRNEDTHSASLSIVSSRTVCSYQAFSVPFHEVLRFYSTLPKVKEAAEQKTTIWYSSPGYALSNCIIFSPFQTGATVLWSLQIFKIYTFLICKKNSKQRLSIRKYPPTPARENMKRRAQTGFQCHNSSNSTIISFTGSFSACPWASLATTIVATTLLNKLW